ncbi:MAG: carbohydrate kinase family protein [Anaerolineales bacterium]
MISYPTKEGPVLVIGAAGIDIVGRALAALEPGTSNPGRLRISHGGVARNVAVNLAHLATEAVLITAVGDDPLGHQVLDRSNRAGVDVSGAIISPHDQTGSYLAVLDDKGSLQHGLDDMGVISGITPESLRARRPLFERAAIVVLDCNLPAESLQTAIDLAKNAGALVAADPTSGTLAPRLKPHLNDLWLLSPNEREAEELCPLSIPHSDEARAIEAARLLNKIGVDIVMITRAEYGVGYATTEGSGHVPAVQTEVADPTGAGDALLATVIVALINQIPIDEAVRLGVTAASLTLRTHDSVIPDLSLELLYDQLV